MAVTVNGYNIGTDAQVTISDIYGDVFPADLLGLLTDFTSTSEDTELEVVPITNGGVPIFQTVWKGVKGSMRFVRQNGNFQAFFMELMDAYHNSGFITQFSLTLSIQNRDGTVDEYLLSGVQFNKPAFGGFQNQKEVDMSTNFSASRMQVMGGATPFLPGLPVAA